MTGKALEHAESVLRREGVRYSKLEAARTSDSEIVASLFRAAGIIIAAPTYEYKLFPPVAAALSEAGRKRITGKAAFRFGSYGWWGAEGELEIVEETG